MSKIDRTVTFRYDSGEAGGYGAESVHEREQRERYWRSLLRKALRGATWKALR